jgi:Flp pilus assembly protein TadG
MQVTAIRRRHGGERGSAMLESALILGVTIMLVLGVIDLCQVFMQIQYMNERARSASRWAAANWNPNTDSIDAIKNYAVFNSPSSTTSPGIMGLAPSNVTVSLDGTPNTMSYRVTVSISKQVRFVSPYIARTFTPRASVATSSMESMGLSGDNAFVPTAH